MKAPPFLAVLVVVAWVWLPFSCLADEPNVVTVRGAEDYAALEADSEVVCVEFYSKYCGSCAEFSEHWHTLERKYAGKLKFARVKIDDSGPMKVAQKEGALSGGIPHVRLLTGSGSGDAVVLMSGGSGIKKSHVLAEEIDKHLSSFSTDPATGRWLKKSSGSEL